MGAARIGESPSLQRGVARGKMWSWNTTPPTSSAVLAASRSTWWPTSASPSPTTTPTPSLAGWWQVVLTVRLTFRCPTTAQTVSSRRRPNSQGYPKSVVERPLSGLDAAAFAADGSSGCASVGRSAPLGWIGWVLLGLGYRRRTRPEDPWPDADSNAGCPPS